MRGNKPVDRIQRILKIKLLKLRNDTLCHSVFTSWRGGKASAGRPSVVKSFPAPNEALAQWRGRFCGVGTFAFYPYGSSNQRDTQLGNDLRVASAVTYTKRGTTVSRNLSTMCYANPAFHKKEADEPRGRSYPMPVGGLERW